MQPAPGLKVPLRPAMPEVTAPPEQAAPTVPAEQKPVPEPAPSPAPSPLPSSEAGTGDLAAAPPEKAAPPKPTCTIDVGPWPADKTDQGKAIQILLRALGFYEGTLYGTVGPTTRAAIRKFQLSVGQTETGEPDEALFESLKKRCAS